MTRRSLSARLVLVGLVALLFAAEFVRPSRTSNLAPEDPSDDQLFEAVINRVRIGEPYYPAMGAELRARNYPTASLFNWRTPWLFELMAMVPSWMWPLAIGGLCIGVMVLTVIHVNHMKAIAGIPIAIIAQVGALRLLMAPSATVQMEVWCGALMAISVLAYARHAWMWGMVLGAVALFTRELAAPYCLLCFLIAARNRRRGELIAWMAAGLAYLLLFTRHALHVWGQPVAHEGPAESWVQFGGVPFLVETIQKTNGILLVVPHVLTAIVIVLLAAALWAPAPAHVEATVIAYLLLYAIVGQPFNHYWGFVTAPTYAVALAYGPIGVHTLVRAAFPAGQPSPP